MLAHKKSFSQETGAAKGPEVDFDTHITEDEFYYKLSAEDINDPANNWEKKMDIERQNGMSGKIYTKSVPGYRVDWIHSDAVYEGVTMDTFIKMNRDVNRMFKGHAQHKEMKTLEVDDGRR